MQLEWKSKKGGEREHNNDYVSTVIKPGVFFVILVDSDCGDEQQSLSKHWANSMSEFISSSKQIPTQKVLLDFIKKYQLELRQGFLHAIASYIFILINTENDHALIFNCGDCKVGYVTDETDLRWLNTTHSLSTTRFGGSSTRNVLTKCLSARKYHEPDILEFTYSNVSKWIMCTDGYWGEYLDDAVPWSDLTDDASCLTITHDGDFFQNASDSENFSRW